MKRIYLFTLFTALAIITNAQKIEFTALTGYTVNDNLRTYYASSEVDNTSNFGGILSIEVVRGSFMELSYSRNDTRFYYYNDDVGSRAPLDIAIEHYQFGSLQQFDVHKIIKPFAGLSIGLSRYHPKEKLNNREIDNMWAFTPILAGGVKISITEWLGVRLQGRFILPFHLNMGSDYTAGNGGLIGIPNVSADFSAGLVLRINRNILSAKK